MVAAAASRSGGVSGRLVGGLAGLNSQVELGEDSHNFIKYSD